MQKYKVLREHHGEKDYAKGDTREALPSDVAHLVQLGILEPLGSQEEGDKKAPDLEDKKAPELSNKQAKPK